MAPSKASPQAKASSPRRAAEGDANRTEHPRGPAASGARIGPGKVAVLEAIALSRLDFRGPGRAALRTFRIGGSWELVEDLNATLGAPVVQTAAGKVAAVAAPA